MFPDPRSTIVVVKKAEQNGTNKGPKYGMHVLDSKYEETLMGVSACGWIT